MRGCTVKISVALNELPNFMARPGTCEPHHMAQINTPLTKEEWRDGFARASVGELPERLWTELYFQSAHDESVAPKGKHIMSVFAQYVPYAFAEGDWESRREEVGDLAIGSIARFCSKLAGGDLGIRRSWGHLILSARLACVADISSRESACRPICGTSVSPIVRRWMDFIFVGRPHILAAVSSP